MVNGGDCRPRAGLIEGSQKSLGLGTLFDRLIGAIDNEIR